MLTLLGNTLGRAKEGHCAKRDVKTSLEVLSARLMSFPSQCSAHERDGRALRSVGVFAFTVLSSRA